MQIQKERSPQNDSYSTSYGVTPISLYLLLFLAEWLAHGSSTDMHRGAGEEEPRPSELPKVPVTLFPLPAQTVFENS